MSTPRRSKRLNTRAYKAAAVAKKEEAAKQDKILVSFFRSEGLEKHHAKQMAKWEYESHYNSFTLSWLEDTAKRQLAEDCKSAEPDSSLYRELVEGCVRYASLEYDRAVASFKEGHPRIEEAFRTLLKWDDELKLLSGDCD